MAACPVPVIRSAVSSRVGGLPAGTVMVGATPAVPAAERSALGMVVGGPEVVGVAAVVGGGTDDVGADDELPHPARATEEAASTASDQVRKRGMRVLSGGGASGRRLSMTAAGQTVAATWTGVTAHPSPTTTVAVTPVCDHVPMTLQLLQRVADDLRSVLSDFEPERVSGPDAARLLERFAEIEKLAAGGKLLTVRRVESSMVWRRQGHRSAAAHVAEATGTGLGPAITAIEAARQVGSLPATEDAMRAGRLSEAQVKEIAGAAILQPAVEQELVDAAETQPHNLLKLRCRRVRAAGQDQMTSYEKIRRERYLRSWTDHDGAVRFDARMTPDDGARLVAAIKAEADRLGASARRAGIDEPARAVAADALVRLVGGDADRLERSGGEPGSDGAGSTAGPGGSPRGPSTMVHVRVDHGALMRGHLEPGEVCEIPGIGPIPVEVARSLAVDSVLSVLLTDGVDVTTVAHTGRTIPASVRRALIERDPVCVVPGCGLREGLEIDHIDPFGNGGQTRLDNLARLCRWHHYLKTHQHHRLERHGREWRWTTPEDIGPAATRLDRSG